MPAGRPECRTCDVSTYEGALELSWRCRECRPGGMMGKERPILFEGEMVRAILDGRKTETRRVIKPQPTGDGDGFLEWRPRKGVEPLCLSAVCPYGVPGDKLWCKETWCDAFRRTKTQTGVIYRADYLPPTYLDEAVAHDGRWRPSIHMPRWASRITLEVTGVSVERVQDITGDAVMAEGVRVPVTAEGAPLYELGENMEQRYGSKSSTWKPVDWQRAYFAKLWDEINAKRGYSWEANPYVWVVKFRKED